MGMFDWYRPRAEIQCPECGMPLKEWQGKDGPRALFVWSEGERWPIDQLVEEEWKLPEDERRKFELPIEFLIYSYDCDKHVVSAKGKTIDGVWSETTIHPQVIQI